LKALIWLSSDCTSLEEIIQALESQGQEAAILLVQDGVFMADKGCPHSDELKTLKVKVYASKKHVEERGLGDRLVVDVDLVTYSRIVDLIMDEYDKVISL
jgi:sulfur relay protein TusB/DsrH